MQGETSTVSDREWRHIDLSLPGGHDEEGDDQPTSPVYLQAQDAAAIVREVYIQCRRRFTGQNTYGQEALPWDGEEDAWGRKRSAVWPKLAAHIVRLGASPVDYVTAQFWYTRQNERAIAPNQMYSEAAVARYTKYEKNLEHELRLQLVQDTSSIRVMVKSLMEALGWEHIAALKHSLFDIGQVSARPLARFCVAVEYNLPEVAAHYRRRALLQYVFQKRQYDKAWAGCIPETLQAEGAALVERMGG